jgi:hypothetical protein
MTDLFGVPLVVGDIVAFTTSNKDVVKDIRIGIIKEITKKCNSNEVAIVEVKASSSIQFSCFSKSLIAVAPIKQQHPELFI